MNRPKLCRVHPTPKIFRVKYLNCRKSGKLFLRIFLIHWGKDLCLQRKKGLFITGLPIGDNVWNCIPTVKESFHVSQTVVIYRWREPIHSNCALAIYGLSTSSTYAHIKLLTSQIQLCRSPPTTSKGITIMFPNHNSIKFTDPRSQTHHNSVITPPAQVNHWKQPDRLMLQHCHWQNPCGIYFFFGPMKVLCTADTSKSQVHA